VTTSDSLLLLGFGILAGMLGGIAAQLGAMQRINREQDAMRDELEYIKRRLAVLDQGVSLTERQYAILMLRRGGLSVSDIARHMSYSDSTIEKEITQLKAQDLLD